jgi:hypothetical protein
MPPDVGAAGSNARKERKSMKRVLLVLVLMAAVSLIATGCQKSAHDRYREWTYRRVMEVDAVGFADDVDTVFLSERPTHLSQWYTP